MYLATTARLATQTWVRPTTTLRRCLATTVASHSTTLGSSSSSLSSSNNNNPNTPVSLSNVEASWSQLTNDEKSMVHNQLEELQKKDWKELSLVEKKAAYYVAFGPHGPRAPSSAPGDGFKIVLGTVGIIGVAASLFFALRSFAPPPPKTMTKEWEEAANVRAREMNLNPITGISSEGYAGKGFVQSK